MFSFTEAYNIVGISGELEWEWSEVVDVMWFRDLGLYTWSLLSIGQNSVQDMENETSFQAPP